MGVKFEAFKGIDTDDIVRQINKFTKNRQIEYIDLKITSSAATEGLLGSMGGNLRYEQRTQGILVYKEDDGHGSKYNSI